MSETGNARRWWLFRPVRLADGVGFKRFALRVLAQFFVAKLIVGTLFAIALPETDLASDPVIAKLDPVVLVIATLIVAPLLETLVCQTAVIEVMRRFSLRRGWQFAASVILFAALHFPGGIASGVVAGIVGGAFFAHTYLEWRQRSIWKATGAVIVVHAVHNAIVLPLVLMAS